MQDIKEKLKTIPFLQAIISELNEEEKKQLEQFTDILIGKLESSVANATRNDETKD